ncbi:hypothetical protein RHSIM_RhsimUnG0094200 [Rhododendron simsii]|uniref:Uncharacterized protein n=1 Tax=Rhododendron simsii TaxID=118357 RepID=A0A834FVZ7_RHOSS|nr:hypothetical protein RHSIM_RhsimUnG0094200 [Rhododendron simsii]
MEAPTIRKPKSENPNCSLLASTPIAAAIAIVTALCFFLGFLPNWFGVDFRRTGAGSACSLLASTPIVSAMFSFHGLHNNGG